MHFFHGNLFYCLFLLLLVNFYPNYLAAEKSPMRPSGNSTPQQNPTLVAQQPLDTTTDQPIHPLVTAKKPAPARILVAYAIDTASHLGSMMPMIKRLASAGHNVHILHITSEKEAKIATGPNVHEIRIQSEGDDKKEALEQLGSIIWEQTLHAPLMPLIYAQFARGYDSIMLNHSAEVVKLFDSNWDLLILDELFTLHGYALAHLLRKYQQVPYVVFSTSIMLGSSSWANANGHHWLIHPHAYTPTPRHAKDGYKPSSFSHRVINALEAIGELGANLFIENFQIAPRLVQLTGERDFTFSNLYEHSEMSMVSSIAHLALPQTEVTEVLNVGAHCEEAGELPEDYRTFVEDPTSKGTVYVAFGTIIPWDFAPPHVVNAFFDAFERFPDYRFIFSFNGKHPERKLGSHIRLVNWAPQSAILAHPKTKVFLTHCGLKSIKESICSKIPMLVMPVFAEQNHNAHLMVEMGIGIVLNKYAISANGLESSLNEVLGNPEYADRVAKLQKIFMDRPIDELDQAEFYVRKIIDKGKKKEMEGGGGGKHIFFKRKGIHLNSLEYFHFDVALLFFAFIFLVSR